MPLVNIRLIGRDRDSVQAAISELHYVTSGVIERPAGRITLQFFEPREGRRDEWLAYGSVIVPDSLVEATHAPDRS